MKCKMCGKVFKPKNNRTVFCSSKCSEDYWYYNCSAKKAMINLAKSSGMDIDTDKIIEICGEKIRRFGKRKFDYIKCITEPKNPTRYCGSIVCFAEIFNKGTCQCGLFKRRDKE